MHIDQLKPIVEAALLASPQPLSANQLAALFSDAEVPTPADIAQALQQLQDDCAGRGVELVEVASGFRYQVRQSTYAWVARLWAERPARYSRALLETLSLIAYRQPITRGEIEQVRGVVVSTSIIRTLEEREWIRVVGYRDVPGKPALYGTSKEFLDYFKLRSLDQLPALADERDMEAIDPQLNFDGERPAIAAQAAVANADDDTNQAASETDPTDPIAPVLDAQDNLDHNETMTDHPDAAPEESRA
ncbi:MAG: SMC-Scp complex subunit ScpB [Xanthomonadales bacterium]|nr:SMC-Scp complex subunit ScpB [Xanthomonadales bacterium]